MPKKTKTKKAVKKKAQAKKRKKKVKATLTMERVLTESSDAAHEFYNQSRFGSILEDGDKGKILIKDYRKKKVNFDDFIKKTKKVEPNFWIRYCVFKDIRDRGYIIKTALKFGADFRVYDRGVKPGEDHARWIVYPVHEGSALTWYDFAAKNRVAHSTKKRLMIGIVDNEGDVTYYEIKWIRP